MFKQKKQIYLLRGYDAYDHPMEEMIEYSVPTISTRFKTRLAAMFSAKWAYRLGLSRFRPISKIIISGK
jgi:hypothetical protein